MPIYIELNLKRCGWGKTKTGGKVGKSETGFGNRKKSETVLKSGEINVLSRKAASACQFPFLL